MTVAELRKALDGLPDDMIVMAFTGQANICEAFAVVEELSLMNDDRPYLWIEGDAGKRWA